MINILVQNIELGPRQLSLFESESDAMAEQESLKTCVVGHIDMQNQIDLCGSVQMATNSLGWPKFKVLQNLFWLAQDFEIIFKIGTKNITPRIARNTLIESVDSNVMIALNKPVDESVFRSVIAFYQNICCNTDADVVPDQAELARLLAGALRNWKNSLESCRRYAQPPGFPGKKDIKAGLALIGNLSEKQDSFSLVTIFSEKSEEIAQLVKTVEVLTFFYTHHKDLWQRMVNFAQESKNTLGNHIENPEVDSDYKRFIQILSSTRPYDLVDEADRLHKDLKIHYDKIVAHQTKQLRKKALSNLTSLIEKMKAHLQAHAAPDDLRNQALYPLRTKSNQIKMAGTISKINRLMQEAQEAFEIFCEEVIE